MTERNIKHKNKFSFSRWTRERVKNSRSPLAPLTTGLLAGQAKAFFLTVIILSVVLFAYQPASAAESSPQTRASSVRGKPQQTSFVSHTLASVGSFFKSIIFSDKTNEDSKGESASPVSPSEAGRAGGQPTPTYTYSKQEVEKLVKDETANIKKESQALQQEVSNLKQEVTNLDRTQTIITQPVIEKIIEQPGKV
ncbi:MAG: hypothetical protein Q8Q21_00210, partial [bacterium]|nr:hypothetical protein [bacterium]